MASVTAGTFECYGRPQPPPLPSGKPWSSLPCLETTLSLQEPTEDGVLTAVRGSGPYLLYEVPVRPVLPAPLEYSLCHLPAV